MLLQLHEMGDVNVLACLLTFQKLVLVSRIQCAATTLSHCMPLTDHPFCETYLHVAFSLCRPRCLHWSAFKPVMPDVFLLLLIDSIITFPPCQTCTQTLYRLHILLIFPLSLIVNSVLLAYSRELQRNYRLSNGALIQTLSSTRFDIIILGMSSPLAATKVYRSVGNFLSGSGGETMEFGSPALKPRPDTPTCDPIQRKDSPKMTAGAFAVKWQFRYAGENTESLEGRYRLWYGKHA